jgi:membrane-bound serine protease (ClpP class)
VSTFGLVLLALAAVLAAAEAHVAAYGILGALAVMSLSAGIALTIVGAGANVAVAIGVAVAVGVVGAIVGAIAVRTLLAGRRAPVRGGPAGLIGHRGEVRTAPEPVGHVLVDGALWRARAWSLEDDRALRPGDPIVVEAIDGLTLTVRRAEEWEVVA